MSAHVIDETCSCGASIRVAGGSVAVGNDVTAWRKSHRHDVKPAEQGIPSPTLDDVLWLASVGARRATAEDLIARESAQPEQNRNDAPPTEAESASDLH